MGVRTLTRSMHRFSILPYLLLLLFLFSPLLSLPLSMDFLLLRPHSAGRSFPLLSGRFTFSPSHCHSFLLVPI